MALSKTKFRALATKLFGKAEAGELTVDAEFSVSGGIDPITGVPAAGISETVIVVPESYDEAQVDGQAIQRGDFKLLARFESFSAIDPTTNGVNVSIAGKNYAIVTHKNEFDILYTLQVRSS